MDFAEMIAAQVPVTVQEFAALAEPRGPIPPPERSTMNAADFANEAIEFLTGRELSPSTRDLLTLMGVMDDGQPGREEFTEEEKRLIVIEVAAPYVLAADDLDAVLRAWHELLGKLTPLEQS